jgi:hypothetical protein
MKKVINEQARTITFSFDAASGLEPVVFNPAKASAANREYAVLHGFAARLGDNAAIAKSKENGFTVTESMRRDAIIELRDHYESGSEAWNVKAASGPRAPAQNPVILAIAAKLGITYEQAMAKVAEQFLAELGGAPAETGTDAAAK